MSLLAPSARWGIAGMREGNEHYERRVAAPSSSATRGLPRERGGSVRRSFALHWIVAFLDVPSGSMYVPELPESARGRPPACPGRQSDHRRRRCRRPTLLSLILDSPEPFGCSGILPANVASAGSNARFRLVFGALGDRGVEARIQVWRMPLTSDRSMSTSQGCHATGASLSSSSRVLLTLLAAHDSRRSYSLFSPAAPSRMAIATFL
jgi:hypothetical protein